MHTTLSGDGRSTLEEIVASAAARGYEYLALTDHAENLAMSGVSRERFRLQRAQIDGLRASYPGMALLHGSELNIGKDGSLDYDLDFRRTLEWCVAGVHSHFDLDAGRADPAHPRRDGGPDRGRDRAPLGPPDRPPRRASSST